MKNFSELVGEKIGEASMCWSETPKGIFDSDTASCLAIDILNAHDAEIAQLKEQIDMMKCCENCRDWSSEKKRCVMIQRWVCSDFDKWKMKE